MYNTRLFAIFCGCRLWGLKTPAIWFFVTGKRKKTKDVEAWEWSIQIISARYFFFQAYVWFINIIFMFGFNFNWTKQLSWWMRHWIIPWDLGSIPRSPKRLFYFFITCSNATLSSDVHHARSNPRCHVSWSIDMMAMRCWTPCSQSKHAWIISRKSTRLDC